MLFTCSAAVRASRISSIRSVSSATLPSRSSSAPISCTARSRFAVTAASGLLISCATPAAIEPIEAMRSATISCAWVRTCSVTSRPMANTMRSPPTLTVAREKSTSTELPSGR